MKEAHMITKSRIRRKLATLALVGAALVGGGAVATSDAVQAPAAEAATGVNYTTRHCTYPAKARISVSSYGSAVYVEGRSAYTGALLGTYAVGANVRTGWINFGGEAITFRLSSAGSYGYSTTCF
jgi:hypothetical protein